MDLLVGLWAERNLPTMDAEQLTAMETVLDQENPDLFKWLTGQEEPPEAMKTNPAFTVRHRHMALCSGCVHQQGRTVSAHGPRGGIFKESLNSTSRQSLDVAQAQFGLIGKVRGFANSLREFV